MRGFVRRFVPVLLCSACMGAVAHADTIDFRQFSGYYDTPTLSGTTINGVGFTISGSPTYEAMPQGMAFWEGAFPNGNRVLFAPDVGPTTILFDDVINGISNLGLQSNNWGPYTATLTAYGLDGTTVLGTSSYSAVSANAPGTQLGFSLAVAGIRSIVLSSTNDLDGVGLGNITILSAVPEPATWAMMIAGFAMAGVAMRRRKPIYAMKLAYAGR